MLIRLLYSSSVKEIFIAPVNHEQIPTNANDPQKQTQQLWIKKVDVRKSLPGRIPLEQQQNVE